MLGRDDGPGALHAPVSDVRIDVGGAGDQRKKVVVIGAGFAGLSAACYLAKEGFAVTVIDRLPEVHNARFRTPLCSADMVMSVSHLRGFGEASRRGPPAACASRISGMREWVFRFLILNVVGGGETSRCSLE